MPAARRWSRTPAATARFLGVMDFDVKGGQVADFRYRLLPVFANQLKADPAMDALITRVRRPFEAKLAEKLAVSDGLLFGKRGFSVAAPTAGNSLPSAIKSAQSLEIFKEQLKTYLFTISFA